MTLRARLALVSILILGLPLAGWQLVRSLESALRDSYQQTLIDTVAAAAHELAVGEKALPGRNVFFVHPVEGAFEIDGFASDWLPWLEERQSLPGGSSGLDAHVTVAERRERLLILVESRDDELTLSRPDGDPGDRIELELHAQDTVERLTIAPLAPGWVNARSQSGRAHVQAALQPSENGWTMELRVERPRSLSALGLTIVDVDGADSTRLNSAVRALARPSGALSKRLDALLPEQTRGWVTGPGGWIVARAGRTPAMAEGAGESQRQGLLATSAARLLGVLPGHRPRRGPEVYRLDAEELSANASARWYQLPAGDGFMISASAPIRSRGALIGHVVIERPADRFMTRAYLALLQLFVLGLAGMLFMAALLIGFAGWLSSRIRRLRDAVDSAVAADGRVHGPVESPRGSDEIADLGRSLVSMVERQRQHQDYLRTLSSKLSHELKTPLAMIRSSLDNLAEVNDETSRERYRQRAEAGCRRLQQTFLALSQAARIEESLSEEAMVELDLGQLVERYAAGCRQAFDSHRFSAVVPAAGRAVIAGAADQLAQLLDKLVENAVAFSPGGSRITLRVVPMHRRVALQVDNTGSQLPDLEERQLFESMTSTRIRDGDRTHLGLGLFIVRLIAQRHGGRIRAMNRGDGVRFQVDFPSRTGRRLQELP